MAPAGWRMALDTARCSCAPAVWHDAASPYGAAAGPGAHQGARPIITCNWQLPLPQASWAEACVGVGYSLAAAFIPLYSVQQGS